MKLKTCRICLAMGVKMSSLGEDEVTKFIENIFKSHGFIQNLDKRHYACYECKALLSKTYNFMQKSLRAQKEMYDIIKRDKVISLQALRSIDRKALDLMSKLSYHRVDIDFIVEEGDNEATSTIESDCKTKIFKTLDAAESNTNYFNISAADIPGCYEPEVTVKEENVDNSYSDPLLNATAYIEIEENQVNCKKKSIRKRNKGPQISATNIITGCRKRQTKYTRDSDSDSIETKNINKKNDDDYKPQKYSESSDSPYDSFDDEGRRIKKPKEVVRDYPRKCDHCTYEIEQRQQHFKHYLFCHPNVEYPYHREASHVCQFCGARKRSEYLLRDHELLHSDEKNVKCPMCPKKFKNKVRLYRHRKRFHSDRVMICDYCNKSFKAKSDLTLHIRTHTGEKPFKCHICGVGYAHRGNVTVHIRNIHQSEAAKPKRKVKKTSQKSNSATTEKT